MPPAALPQCMVVHSKMLPALHALQSGSEKYKSTCCCRWEEEEVNRRLDKAMTDSFAAIWEVHNQKNIPLRVAAFHVALQRVTRAHVHRGFD